jgi:hypothetical protein
MDLRDRIMKILSSDDKEDSLKGHNERLANEAAEAKYVNTRSFFENIALLFGFKKWGRETEEEHGGNEERQKNIKDATNLFFKIAEFWGISKNQINPPGIIFFDKEMKKELEEYKDSFIENLDAGRYSHMRDLILSNRSFFDGESKRVFISETQESKKGFFGYRACLAEELGHYVSIWILEKEKISFKSVTERVQWSEFFAAICRMFFADLEPGTFSNEYRIALGYHSSFVRNWNELLEKKQALEKEQGSQIDMNKIGEISRKLENVEDDLNHIFHHPASALYFYFKEMLPKDRYELIKLGYENVVGVINKEAMGILKEVEEKQNERTRRNYTSIKMKEYMDGISQLQNGQEESEYLTKLKRHIFKQPDFYSKGFRESGEFFRTVENEGASKDARYSPLTAEELSKIEKIMMGEINVDGFDKMTSGSSRDVYSFRNGEYIVKIERGNPEQNKIELTVFEKANARLKEFLVPIIESDKNYRWMVQPRAETAENMPLPKLYRIFNELNESLKANGISIPDFNPMNIGLLNNKPVITDYGFDIKYVNNGGISQSSTSQAIKSFNTDARAGYGRLGEADKKAFLGQLTSLVNGFSALLADFWGIPRSKVSRYIPGVLIFNEETNPKVVDIIQMAYIISDNEIYVNESFLADYDPSNISSLNSLEPIVAEEVCHFMHYLANSDSEREPDMAVSEFFAMISRMYIAERMNPSKFSSDYKEVLDSAVKFSQSIKKIDDGIDSLSKAFDKIFEKMDDIEGNSPDVLKAGVLNDVDHLYYYHASAYYYEIKAMDPQQRLAILRMPYDEIIGYIIEPQLKRLQELDMLRSERLQQRATNESVSYPQSAEFFERQDVEAEQPKSVPVEEPVEPQIEEEPVNIPIEGSKRKKVVLNVNMTEKEMKKAGIKF